MGRRKREPALDAWWDNFTVADFDEAFAARRRLLDQIGQGAASAVIRDPWDPKNLALVVYTSSNPVPASVDGHAVVYQKPEIP